MKKMTIIYILLGIVVLVWALNIHIWPQQLKRGVYKESTWEKIIRVVTGRVDD